MNKIPVGATIAHAYRFAFAEFFNLLKLLWLPLIVMLGLNLFVGPQISALSRGLTSHDYSGMTMPWPLVLLLGACAWTFSFMLITAAFQYALGQDEARNRNYYLSFAMPLWRMIGALLILVLLVLAILFVLAIIIILLLFRLGLGAAHVSDAAIKMILAWDVALAFLAGYCGAVFCGLRFGFLLGATTIAEKRIGLFRSWTLSHGNFWRMFVVSLALFLPFLVLEGLAFYALGIFPHLPPGASPVEIRALQNAASATAMARMQHYRYFVYPGGAVVALLLYGLMAGGGVFAYRVLSGPSDSKPSLP
jgi:hypothetical protein